MSPPPVLGFSAILRHSVAAVWQARRELVDFALLPMIYSLGLLVFIYLVADGPPLTTNEAGQAVPGDPVYFIAVLIVVPMAMFIAGWTRRTLYGAAGPAYLPGLRWTRHETRVLFAMIVLFVGTVFVSNMIGLIATAVLGTLAINPFVAATLVFVPAIYFFARTSLLPVLAASGAPGGFIRAWRIGAGNGHRLAFMLITLGFCTLVVASIAAAAITLPLAAIYGGQSGIGIGGNVATGVVTLLIEFTGAAITSEALARVYRELGGPLAPPAAND